MAAHSWPGILVRTYFNLKTVNIMGLFVCYFDCRPRWHRLSEARSLCNKIDLSFMLIAKN